MDVSEYLNRARSALKDGELDLANQYFNQVLRMFPNNTDALEGLKDLEVAQAKKKWSPVTRAVKLGAALLLKTIGKPDKAYNDLKLIHRINPNHIGAAMAFADCARRIGNDEEAHKAYTRVLSIQPQNQKALQADAEILAHLARFEESQTLFTCLQALRPNDDKISHRLRDITAQAYARVGIPEDLKARRAAMEKEKLESPIPPEILERVEKLLQAYKRNPDDKATGVEIAAHYREGNLLEEANRILSSILDKDPQFEPARREQARVWRESGELDIAVNLYEELLAASPHDQPLKDEYLGARVDQLRKEVHANPQDKEALIQMERVIQEREKNRIVMLRRLIKERPEAYKERAELGELFLKFGKIEEAITVLQRLVHEPSWAGRVFYLLGQCFRAQGDYQLAVGQFDKALEFFKNKGYSHVPTEELKAVYYYLGLSKEELGDKTGAREAYGQVYSTDIHYKDVRQRYENTFK